MIRNEFDKQQRIVICFVLDELEAVNQLIIFQHAQKLSIFTILFRFIIVEYVQICSKGRRSTAVSHDMWDIIEIGDNNQVLNHCHAELVDICGCDRE